MEAVASASRGPNRTALRVWGPGSFENEAAMKWLEGLEDADDLEMLEETLDEVLELDGDVPSEATSARAVAAAETVAALGQSPAKSLPEEVRQWCFDNPGLELEEVQAKAMQALGSVLQDSGLRELFEESGDAEDWENELEDLRDRLRS